MRGKYLQTAITSGRFALPVAIIITIACWAIVYFLIPDIPKEENRYAFWESLTAYSIPDWGERLISFTIYMGIGYLMILMNNTFGLIRVRASIQTATFVLFVAVCPSLQQLNRGSLAALMFIIALYLLFSAYQTVRSSGYLFHSFLFVGLSSLIFPQITLLTPILLIGAFNFQALNPRSFFAAIIGWSFPYWFLFGHAYFYDNIDLFYQPFIELATFYPIDFSLFTNWEIAILAYSFVLFLISSIHSFAESYKDKIRTRIHLRFFILLNVCIYILIVLQPVHCINLLPLLLIGVSMLTSHMFVLTRSKASNIFFIITIIGLILLFLYNVWMLL